ncbi:MAG: uracil-DNA glycosylase [SAR324 cluster bacterium]|nr:uracil-DNA glycosylase [SAR324 cluster bacterium]
MLAKTLDSLKLRLRNCNRCNLCNERQTVVCGQGNIYSELVFIGEGPGADEDKSGIAFVGKAGKLLTQMIHAIGINRESVFICNVVKCRPPGNRNPEPEEIAICSQFLLKQLEILKPKLIVTLGNIATKTLLPHAAGIMKMRGQLTTFREIQLIPTLHPSYLLRNPSALNLVWDDMRHIRQVLFNRSQKPTKE